MKNKDGITLIALIITIIILLILAGVVLNIVFNQGIINKSEIAVDTYSEQQAREKLEVSLANMAMEKYINSAYNSDTYLTNELIKEGYIVSGDIVIVDGWQFTIDRSVPKIGISIGKGTLNANINIQIEDAIPSTDFVTASITATITSDKEISKIYLNGVELAETDYTISSGVITITKENITENMTISILAKDLEGNYNTNSKKIDCITEDMDIWNLADLKLFRDRVNAERTYEGIKVNVMADIDMKSENWTPIANYSDKQQIFKGTFNGNNHKLTNLSVDNSADYQGLFGYSEGTIQDIIIESGTVKGVNKVGAIVGASTGNIINCTNKANLDATGYHVGGICGYSNSTIQGCENFGECKSGSTSLGGIVGKSDGIIRNCNNNGVVLGSNQGVGGIVGGKVGGTVSYCSNTNIVTTTGYNTSKNSHIGGIVGNGITDIINIEYCYNVGDVTGEGCIVGGIVGSIKGTIRYCYNTGTITAKNENIHKNIFAGGIVGSSEYNDNAISNCYNVGNVICKSGTNKHPGGIVGYNATGCTVNNCYTLDTKISNIMGYNSGDEPTDCDALSDDEMKNADFIDLIGGIENWKFVSGDYPKLEWE